MMVVIVPSRLTLCYELLILADTDHKAAHVPGSVGEKVR